MDKKKTLILSILGVIVLVIAVVGISYAMYTFTGTGTRENYITTGKVSVSYGETKTIVVTNMYPSEDAVGSQVTETLDFTVTSSMQGSTLVNYEVQLLVTEDNTTGGLKDEHVNINIKKDAAYIQGTTATTGRPLSDWASTNGTIITSGNYVIDNGSFNGSGTAVYQIKAWVNDTYDLKTNGMVNNDNVHTNNTETSTLSFTVKVVAVG